MLKATIFVLFSALIAGAYSLKLGGDSCINTDIIPDFNATRYVGKWYEIERFDYIFESGLSCVTAEYGTINSTFVSVRNGGFYVSTQKFDYRDGYAHIPNVQEPNKLLVTLPIMIGNTTLFENTGNYNVWETDYTTYSVVYSCSKYFNLIKSEIAWILSRTKTLDPALVASIKQRLTAKGLNINKFIHVDQSCKN